MPTKRNKCILCMAMVCKSQSWKPRHVLPQGRAGRYAKDVLGPSPARHATFVTFSGQDTSSIFQRVGFWNGNGHCCVLVPFPSHIPPLTKAVGPPQEERNDNLLGRFISTVLRLLSCFLHSVLGFIDAFSHTVASLKINQREESRRKKGKCQYYRIVDFRSSMAQSSCL